MTRRWKKMKPLSKVRTWFDTKTGVDEHSIMNDVFTGVTYFNHIYVPTKIPTSTGMPVDWAWVDVGMAASTLAETYRWLFGENYWVEPLIDRDDDYYISINNMARRVEAVYRLYMDKYAKLIELGGYTYNPLFNVDGTEEYTFLESDGTITTRKTLNFAQRQDGEGGTVTSHGSSNDNESTATHKIAPYNSASFNNASEDKTQTSHKNTDQFNKTYTIGSHMDTDVTTFEHTAIKTSTGTDAFGDTIGNADRYHAEKRIKQGNIGVTKAQELIQAQREILRYSVIDEFFKDINEQILVGIY